MKRTNRIKGLIAAIILFAIMPLSIIPSSATPALPPTYLNGRDYYDAQVSNESEIIIENQSITFDIKDFPPLQNYEKSKDYKGSVTTEYTLFNPTDSEVTVKVAHPINSIPSYYYSENDSEPTKHSIFINGKRIETELRYYVNVSNEYEIDLLSIISDEYINNEFCGPNMSVTKYVFKQSGVNQQNAYAGFDIDKEKYFGSCFYIKEPETNSFSPFSSTKRVTMSAGENGSTVEVYVLGKEPDQMPEWKFYSKFTGAKDSVIEGSMELVSKETSTFLEFVSERYNESFGISEIDYFNIFATIAGNLIKNGTVFTSNFGYKNGFKYSRERCFIYDITIPPKERVVNTINAPIYPSIETGYEPHVYEYTYLLHQANAKMFTGQINVKVNTPYYMLQGKGFEKTDYGYSLTMNPMDSISENTTVIHGGIFFTICESEAPEEVEQKGSGNWAILLIPIMIILLPFILIKNVVTFISNGINSLIQKIKGVK